MKSSKVLSINDYRQNDGILETETNAPPALVLDFSSRGREITERKRVTQRAAERSLVFLEVMNALTRDYENQMLTIANQMTREEWREKHDTDPYGQIEYDMRRLQQMLNALAYALSQRGARSLAEAWEMVLSWPDGEVRSTMEYIQGSDYFGFAAIWQVARAAGFEGHRYVENMSGLYELFKGLQEKGFVYCIPLLSNLFLNDAVAV